MPLYSDINIVNPTEQPMVEDFQSVYQSLIVLFNTRPGEILFNPEYGIDIEENLFEIIDDLSAALLYNQVFIAIQKFEPRVIVDNANSSVISNPDENVFELILQFTIQGLDSTQNFQIIGNFGSP